MLAQPPLLSKASQTLNAGTDVENPLPLCLEVLRSEARELLACAERLEQSFQNPHAQEEGALQAAQSLQLVFKLLMKTLSRGGKIVISGMGKSGKIAEKIVATCVSLGIPCVFLHPSDAFHGDLGMLQTSDILWAISYSGNSEELVKLAQIAKGRGLQVIGMGGKQSSCLFEISDGWLDIRIEQEAGPLGMIPTASTTLAMALGDAIALALMQARGFTADQFAQNHPGGSLGRQLHQSVRDFMIPLKHCGQVHLQDSVQKVLKVASTLPLGAVLVVDESNKNLIGIITDGDLRRAMGDEHHFFKKRACDFMTKNPITIFAHEKALGALHKMEKRVSPIGVLPVFEQLAHRHELIGLIRVHELAKSL